LRQTASLDDPSILDVVVNLSELNDEAKVTVYLDLGDD
jgi:hypothetical protein